MERIYGCRSFTKANHWYHIKITNEDDNRISYYIDGNWWTRDAELRLKDGSAFRTTLSRTRITNFRYECSPQQTSAVPCIDRWYRTDKAVSFRSSFWWRRCISWQPVTAKSANEYQDIPVDTWPLAYWPDGSVKWSGVAGVIHAGTERLTLGKASKKVKLLINNLSFLSLSLKHLKISGRNRSAFHIFPARRVSWLIACCIKELK